MQKFKHYYQKWNDFLNKGKRYYIQSTLFALLLMVATALKIRPDSGWDLMYPSLGMAFFGLRAKEEKTPQALYDFLCVVLWFIEMLFICIFIN